jgi:hypothetical protein
VEDEDARERWQELSGGNPTILVDGRVVMAGGVFTPDVFRGVLDTREPELPDTGSGSSAGI